MSGKFYPDVRHMGELIGGTPSADRRSTVLAAGETARTDWVKRNGSALATLSQTSSPAGLTMRARSSETLPGQVDDTAPIQPADSEWLRQFDGLANTLPTTQGWTLSGSITATPSTTGFRLQSASLGDYRTLAAGFDQSKRLTVVRWRVRRNAGHLLTQNLLTRLGTSSPNQLYLFFCGPSVAAGAGEGKVGIAGGDNYLPGVTMAVDQDWDFAALLRGDGTRTVGMHIFAGAAGVRAQADLSHLLDAGAYLPGYVSQNSILWGSISNSGTSDLTWSGLRVAQLDGDEYGYRLVTDGLPARPVIQVQLSNPTADPITLTAIDLQSNATAPGNPAVSGLDAIGTNALGVLVTPGSDSEAIRLDVLDAGNAVVASTAAYVAGDAVALAVAGLADGTYTARVYGVSDDGVPAAASATSDPITLPPVAASVAITVSPSEIAAGATATLTATLSGGATATLGGSPLTSGVGVTAVTGVGGSLVGPTAPAPVIANLLTPPRPRISYTGDAMRIAQMDPAPTSLRLQVLTDGAYVNNQGAVTYASLTFVGGYATNHGWTLVTGSTYRLVPTYADGSIGLPSLPLLIAEQSAFEVTVGGQVAARWATRQVTATIQTLTTEGAQQYLTTSYSGTVGSDGTWEIAGLPIGEVATFAFPDGSRPVRTLPNEPGAVAFGDLAT